MLRCLALFLALSALALGDVVYLKSGGKLEGKVDLKGDKYEIETATGKVTVGKDEVLRIEKKDFVAPKGTALAGSRVRLAGSYSHPFFAFKIYLPPKWQRGKEQGSTNVSFWGPKDVAYQPRLDLRIVTSKKELIDFVTAWKDEFKKQFKEVSFPFEEALTLRGKLAYEFSVIFSESEGGALGLVQQALYLFLGDGERMYILSFNCSRNWFDRYFTTVDASMKSLRTYPLPAADAQQKQQFLNAYNKAEGDYRAGKLDEALAGFQEAAKLIPEYGDLHATLGTVCMKLGKLPQAETSYRKAIELDPEDYSHHYNLGVCLLKETKVDASIEALKKAVAIDPTAEPAWTNLGVAYLKKDLGAPARENLEKAVAADPESAPAHYNLGVALERLEQKRDAEREYKEALKLDPKHEDAQQALDRLKSRK
ncbi:MAG TPA: tetratricopeptide repeat protein [Planctomycetota bacterium]|nr:tetratricopeptide repeat protein [Planctomycetota bacterium]